MARSLPARTDSADSPCINTWNAASWRAAASAPRCVLRGITTASHHRCELLGPPTTAAGAAANWNLPTTWLDAGSSMREALLAHNMPIADLPCWNRLPTSSLLLASALGVMCGISDRIAATACNPAAPWNAGAALPRSNMRPPQLASTLMKSLATSDPLA